MACVSSMKNERCELSHQSVWGFPYLNVRVVAHGYVSVKCQGRLLARIEKVTDLELGEKQMARTGF